MGSSRSLPSIRFLNQLGRFPRLTSHSGVESGIVCWYDIPDSWIGRLVAATGVMDVVLGILSQAGVVRSLAPELISAIRYCIWSVTAQRMRFAELVDAHLWGYMGTVSLLYSFHGRLHMQSLTFSLRGPCSISCLDVYSMGNSSAGLKVSDVSSSSFSCQTSPSRFLGGRDLSLPLTAVEVQGP